MRILVTGASGFVGGHAVARLAAAGHTVVATGRNVAKLQALERTGVICLPADLAADDLYPLVHDCDAVIHSAALAAPWGPRAAFLRQNLQATERLVAACKTAGSVRRFVHISTPSIYYKPRDQFDIPEAFTPPDRWRTWYAQSKWLAESCVRAPGNHSLRPLILRPRAVFGAGDTAIVPRLLAVARRGVFPLVRGGRASIDVTCIDNLVDAVELALAAPDELAGRAFNITNGEPITVKALVEDLFAALGLEVRLQPVPLALVSALAAMSELVATLRPGRPEPRLTRYGIGLLGYSQTLSIDAARSLLGYRPRISTHEGLRLHAPWYRAHA